MKSGDEDTADGVGENVGHDGVVETNVDWLIEETAVKE